MDPTAINIHDNKTLSELVSSPEFEEELRKALPAINKDADTDSLEGKSKDELIAMLPEELRYAMFPPKGWHRTTSKRRKVVKKANTKYLFKNEDHPRGFARRLKS